MCSHDQSWAPLNSDMTEVNCLHRGGFSFYIHVYGLHSGSFLGTCCIHYLFPTRVLAVVVVAVLVAAAVQG